MVMLMVMAFMVMLKDILPGTDMGGASFAQVSNILDDVISVLMITTQVQFSLPTFVFVPTCVCPTYNGQHCS